MPQCFHLDSRGRRCRRETDDGVYFCDEHALDAEPQRPGVNWRKLGLRLAALVLLVAFLLPLVVRGYRFLMELLN